jgi:DNA-binding IclR family transcriptional regulator
MAGMPLMPYALNEVAGRETCVYFKKNIGYNSHGHQADRVVYAASGTEAMKAASTVTKVCRIIGEFAERKSLGVTDLAKRTELLPSDVHRILASLKASGYIVQDPESKKYQLGFALMRLGLAAFQRNALCERAHPVLVRLAQQLKATTHFGVFDGRDLQVYLIDDVSISSEDRFRAHLGGPARLHCTALGKTILAHLDPQTASYALEKSRMTRVTGRTITDVSVLERQLRTIQEQGYAVDSDECMDGVSCLGCPVRNCEGEVVGAISTSMLTQQFLSWDEYQLAEHLKVAALRINRSLSLLAPTGFSM